MSLQWGSASKALSNTTTGLDPLRQLPVIFSSSIVCELSTWHLSDGPLGAFDSHMYRSACRRASKKIALLQLLKSASSFTMYSWCLVSSLDSVDVGERVCV